MRSLGAAMALSCLSCSVASARQAETVHLLTYTYETTSTGEESSSSSSGQSRLTERVVSASAAGIEVEYDLPPTATLEERARDWKFPVRVFRPAAGPAALRNRAEIEARIETWLKAAKLPREACGTWYFTWSAFQVECDPDLALAAVVDADLATIEVREGAAFRHKDAIGEGKLARVPAKPHELAFSVNLTLDARAIQRERARSDVIVGQLTNKPISLEAALHARERERIEGSLRVTFVTDAAGQVRRRIQVRTVETRSLAGVRREVRTDTLSRTMLPNFKIK